LVPLAGVETVAVRPGTACRGLELSRTDLSARLESEVDIAPPSRQLIWMKMYCFKTAAVIGRCRPSIQEATEDAVRANQAYREGRVLVWRVRGEIVKCGSANPDTSSD
jgi:hypothetical protein